MALQLSGLVNTVKKALVESEGKVTRSEFYFTNLENDEELQLAMTPEAVKVKTDANFRSYNVVEVGQISLPKGEKLTQISWQGILPGARILLAPFVTHKAWEDPKELIKVFKRWREDGAKLNLLITQTPINIDVYIKSFDYEASGGQGNYKYTIELIAAKELQVMTVEEADAKRERDAEIRENELENRARNKSKLGVWISKIDDVWAGVRILTGNGSLSDVERVLSASGLSTIDEISEPQLLIWG